MLVLATLYSFRWKTLPELFKKLNNWLWIKPSIFSSGDVISFCYVNCELICTKLFEHQSQVIILRRSALSFSWQCFMWKTKFSFILSNITIIFPSYFNQERVSFIELNRFWQKFPVSVKLSRKPVCIHRRFPNNISLIRGLSVFFFVPIISWIFQTNGSVIFPWVLMLDLLLATLWRNCRYKKVFPLYQESNATLVKLH